MAVLKTDLDLTTKDLAGLTSPDALAAFLSRLGYDTSRRTVLTPTSLGLSGDTATSIRSIELLSEDEDGFLRVLFVQPKSLTAKVRNDLIRIIGKSNEDYLVVLAATFDTLEFVLLDKKTKEQAGPGGGYKVQVVPKIFSIDRRKPSPQDVRTLRQFTWTHQDALDQFDKLRVVFDNAIFTGEFFQNRGLFSDYFLRERLKEDTAWRENPSSVFQQVRNLYQDAQSRWHAKGRAEITSQLLKPVFGHLGFLPLPQSASAGVDDSKPDFFLKDPTGARNLSAAFVYPWGRWLDGPDFQDPDHPDENPGAKVVAAIEEGHADWAIVTNGRLWRLYSRQAHARSTNFYEVDLIEALNVSGDSDPNEAFRYWWLFFRSAAFQKDAAGESCWLDGILQGSRDYAKRLGDRLKERIFITIFPHLAEGFLADRRGRLNLKGKPTSEELSDVYEATLTLLYRLLFLLYAENRDLLPVREGPYGEASLKKMKEEIAAKAGGALDDANALIEKAYSDKDTVFYDRLCTLFKALDKGNPVLNVPTYNGGLFNTVPDATEDRDQRIARFLRDHRVPDRYLARAIDRLARDQDEKTLGLVFIDFKSLEVRHLGSIYEGLLEFKLNVAEEDLTTQIEKNQEKYIPLSGVKAKRGGTAEVVVEKGKVYLSNDKAERKASGAYYTPDPIVEYIVGQTVGPILDEKLEALRPEFRKVRRTFENELQKATAYPPQGLSPTKDKEAIRRFAIEKTYATHKDLVERLFDIKVLDPAMGSGHFLVEAVDRITDKLLQFLNAFPINPVSFALERTRSSILESLTTQGVTVLRDKLTDINLLKRHVLKRCIYGVDLNPMAVELAKVSLWLDAFTLGAPLSFLDHHLRCGNSLVGATLADIESATSGRLFGLDYGPLLEAIKFVLFVSKVADATAAEVADSISQYGQARKSLSGFQIVLDLVVAEHLGLPRAKALVSSGSDLDLTDRENFLTSLHSDDEKKLVAQVEALARRSDLRFFHWEIEFPEVFTGFFDPNQTKIMHKDKIKPGTAGFDVVIGNPPYVRQEALKPIKKYLKEKYATFDSTNDLYVYFQELEIKTLRVLGRMGMIVANKWMRAGYGEQLRDFLLRTGQPLEVIDFGHAPIFPDADTFPCILLASKRAKALAEREKPAESETMAACDVPREYWHDRMDLVKFVSGRRHPIQTRLLRKEGWSLENQRVQALLDKIRRTEPRLRESCSCPPLSGIKTGLNEAFVIDSTTRSGLIADDVSCSKVIRPLLRGRDMERFRCRESGVFLITIPSSENRRWPWSEAGTRAEQVFKKTLPSIAAHLSPFRDALTRRQDQGRFWWELRSCDYWPKFDEAKLVWQEMAWFTRFAVDRGNQVVLNTAYILPSVDPLIMSCLNSPLAWWYMWRTAQHGKDEVLRLIRDYTEDFPIPTPDSQTRNEIEQVSEIITRHGASINEFENAVADALLKAIHCRIDAASSFELMSRSSEKFVERLAKLCEVRRFEPLIAKALAEMHGGFRVEQLRLLARQLELEREISSLVESAYGLTEEERSLVRSTRPPRDPLDVLEAKIQGRVDPNTAIEQEGV